MRRPQPLLHLPAFAAVGRDEARLLQRNLEVVRLDVGQSVLLGHGPARELLLVLEGELRGLQDPWTAGPGAVVGAHAVLSGSPPSGFRATAPSLVACASVSQTRRLMSGSPAFATAVAVSLSLQLVRATAREGRP